MVYGYGMKLGGLVVLGWTVGVETELELRKEGSHWGR